MADAFKLPRVRAADSIADAGGKASNAFVRFWDTVMKTIERQENAQGLAIEVIQAVTAELAAQLALIVAAQSTADAALALAEDNAGSRAVELTSLAGGPATRTVSNVPSTPYLVLNVATSGGTLNADASFFGTATFAESDGVTTNTLATIPVVVASSGLSLPGPVWEAEGSGPISFSGFGTLSGGVTYSVTITRDSGSSFVAGAVISGILMITPGVV